MNLNIALGSQGGAGDQPGGAQPGYQDNNLGQNSLDHLNRSLNMH